MKTQIIFFLTIFSNFVFSQQMDTSFGDNGTLVIESPGSQDRITLYFSYLTEDNSIVNVGHFDSKNGKDYDFIRKYTSTGTIDTSFGESGEYIVKSPEVVSTTYLLSSAIMNDGSILISIFNNLEKTYFLKVTKTGQTDLSFGNGGYLINPVPSNFTRSDIKVLNDNFISVTDIPVSAEISAFYKNGSINTNFGTNGHVITNFGNLYSNIRSVYSKIRNNKIYLFGYLKRQGVSYSYFACYNENGQLDGNFGNGGFFVLDKFYDNQDLNVDFDIQDDGKILFLAGNAYSDPGQSGPLIRRYNTDGTPDQSFGNMGSTTFSVSGSWTTIWCNVIMQLPNKKILIGSAFNHSSASKGPAILCFNENGTKDLSFGGNVKSTYDGTFIYGLYLLPGVYSKVRTILQDNNNNLVISANPYSFLFAYNFKLNYSSESLHIENVNFQDQLKIYPNPVEHNAIIFNPSQLNVDYDIVDITGKLLKSGNTKNTNIDFSKLTKGNYIVTFKNEKLKSIKVIKR